MLEFGEAETGQAFAAMDLVHGRRLSAILSEGPLEAQTALRIAIDLGGAVETLHNMGLVHGALRPSNVMIASDGHVTLMDVELIGVRAAQAVHGILIDEPPPEYLSPEQIRQVPVTDTTDIYAFAVILYEMLCGGPPFQGETREAVLTKHLTETPAPMRQRRRTAPASLEAIVALALSKVPEPRPPIQTILNRLWEEANRSKTALEAGVRDPWCGCTRDVDRGRRGLEPARPTPLGASPVHQSGATAGSPAGASADSRAAHRHLLRLRLRLHLLLRRARNPLPKRLRQRSYRPQRRDRYLPWRLHSHQRRHARWSG